LPEFSLWVKQVTCCASSTAPPGCDALWGWCGRGPAVQRCCVHKLRNALPVERPSRYYLTVNLKTAKALGLIDSGCG